MHYRFELQRIVDEIVGGEPQVRILQIAWHDKRRYLRKFLRNYYALHRALPHGAHELGCTDVHRLDLGVIDFGRVRARIRESIERDRRRRRREAWLDELRGSSPVYRLLTGLALRFRG